MYGIPDVNAPGAKAATYVNVYGPVTDATVNVPLYAVALVADVQPETDIETPGDKACTSLVCTVTVVPEEVILSMLKPGLNTTFVDI
jgi:hypothetical protein